MSATQTAPTFESVWALMQENALQMEKMQEKADRRQEEIARLFRESKIEADRQRQENERIAKEKSDELNKKIGSLTNLFGDFTLGMVAPKLCDKFFDFGFDFPRANLNVVFNDRINKISFEVDIMLENGDKAILVEVKTKITEERINKHIERLKKMRSYADIRGDKRTFLGAVAGFAMTDELKEKVLEEGFYLIEPDGENFNITPPNNKPKEW
jgi:hypothetical protein